MGLVLNTEYWVLGTGHWLLDTGACRRDSGLATRDSFYLLACACSAINFCSKSAGATLDIDLAGKQQGKKSEAEVGISG